MNNLSGVSLFQILLVDALGKTTLLFVSAFCVAYLLRRASAARQHFLWVLTFGGLVYVTLLSLTCPALHALGLTGVPTALQIPLWRSPETRQTADARLASSHATIAAAKSLPVTGSTDMHASDSGGKSAKAQGTLSRLRERAALVAGMVWLLGCLLSLLRFSGRLRAVRALQRHSLPLENPVITAMLARAAQQLGVKQLPILWTLDESAGLFSPMTWGGKRAFLLLPCGAEKWPTERLEAALLHELAHIRRVDWRIQRIADGICAVYWFHPLVWRAARRLRECAEQACDDMALTHGMAPGTYAQQLLDMAQMLQRARLPLAAGLPMLRRPQIEDRLSAIVNAAKPRRSLSRRAQVAVAGAGAFCLAPLALVLPVTTQSLRVSSPKATTAANNKAVLPGGVTVELVRISAPPPKGAPNDWRRWWLPDGTPLALTFKENIGLFGLNHVADRKNREFLIRLSGLSENYPESLREMVLDNAGKRQTIDSYGETFHNEQTHYTNGRYAVERATYLTLPERAGLGTLRYGLALGKWNDIAIADASLKTVVMTTSDARVTFKTYLDTTYTEAQPDGTRPRKQMLETNDNLGQVARRLVAITRSGKTIKIENISYGPVEARTRLTCLLPDNLPVSEIREFRLQTRPYQWVEFPHVHLEPGK